ncbi:hypothetical protein Tco_1472384 [Tanacetum coccineum]
MEGMIIYMLDDVEYPLPKTTLQKMLDHKCEERINKDKRKDKKDKKKQNQSKTDKKREKTKSRVKNERNQSRISPIQQGRKSKAKIIKPRTNNDKCSKFKGLF